MKVTVYTRTTIHGRRQYRVADKNSTGPFYLRYEENGKRFWKPANTNNHNLAVVSAKHLEAALLTHEPEPTKPSPKPDPTLEEQRRAFLTDRETTYKKDGSPLDPDTIDHYHRVTEEFLSIVQRKYGREITRQDLKNWIAAQRQRVSHRTVCNLYVSIACFLRFCGIDHKQLMPQSERPTPVEETPEAYTLTEVQTFLAAAGPDHTFFNFLYKTGAREREATNLEWTDLNLGPTPTVTFRTKDGFRTKTGKSRTLPLEDSLAAELRLMPRTRYVFGDKPRTHMLDHCKRIAKKAGYDPANFWLHKFRDTFATDALRKGVDIRTVQHWLGHASIEMTQRYLAPEQGAHAQMQINQAFALAVSATA